MRGTRSFRLLCATALGCGVQLTGCGGSRPAPTAPAPRPNVPAQVHPPAPPVRPANQPFLVEDVGFETPESVLHDVEADLYLVSNVAGSPLAPDDYAFISRVHPDGSIENLKWIDADRPEIELDAPKGMALAGDVLYVADISFVRKFERHTGKPLGSIKIEGATFINDVCSDPAGSVYVSDSGIRAGFMPSGGDAIYKLEDGDQVSVLAKSATLGRPNGLAVGADGLWVATFGSGELYQLRTSGERGTGLRPPKGSLDGIVKWNERLFVSSWEGSAVYERQGDGFVERVSGVAAPSDIGFDEKRRRLLIPLFYDNALVIHPL